jgi:hypothetical protein
MPALATNTQPDLLLFDRFRQAMIDVDLASVAAPGDIPASLMIAQEARLASYYIPFESVNTTARVVIVGIAPGFTQWKNAVAEAKRQLAAEADRAQVLHAARLTGAFSGAIRPNLAALLDAIGLNRWLGIASCLSLFSQHAAMAQVTSALRHPVFVNGKNYSGSPGMVGTPFLREQVLRFFADEARMLSQAVFAPMGGSVSEALDWLAAQGMIDPQRILHGLPHPSGANAERIAYFLGRKERATLSAKTNATQLDTARARLLAQVAALP